LVRYYFDSNIFIYAFEYATEVGLAARRAFELVEDGAATAATSIYTLGEVLPHVIRTENLSLETTYRSLFAEMSGIDIVPVTTAIVESAARIVADSQLRLPDAIHVASAIHARCDALLTEDTGIRSISQIRTIRLNDPAFAP
jgi:predicted nucleic acid-binding protein